MAAEPVKALTPASPRQLRENPIDSISVCICTYRRQALLRRLLDGIAVQQTDERFECEVVVVDNDEARSSEEVAKQFAQRSPWPVIYDVEPVRNIAHARNRAVRRATGSLIALIDDDECPGTDWLLTLWRTMVASGADGVLGPVEPELPANAPRWLSRGQVLARKRYVTGTRIGVSDGRTGNALLSRSVVAQDQIWFDPAFGRTGGEDSDFFSRQLARGKRFVWCDEAVAREGVPPERWPVAFQVKRVCRSGTICGEWVRAGRRPLSTLVRSLLGAASHALAMPLLLALPKHLWVRNAQKLAYFTGVLVAFFGVSWSRERD